jgi:hypothetical protein
MAIPYVANCSVFATVMVRLAVSPVTVDGANCAVIPPNPVKTERFTASRRFSRELWTVVVVACPRPTVSTPGSADSEKSGARVTTSVNEAVAGAMPAAVPVTVAVYVPGVRVLTVVTVICA